MYTNYTESERFVKNWRHYRGMYEPKGTGRTGDNGFQQRHPGYCVTMSLSQGVCSL